MFINQILTKLKSLVYSKSETDSLLNGKASSSHTHTKSQITDFPTIPSKTSQLTNDSGFLTSHQDLSGYVPKSGGAVMTGGRISRVDNTYELCIDGGRSFGDGATLTLFGKNTPNPGQEGAFWLTAYNTNECTLVGKTDGSLTWGGTAISLNGHTHTKSQITDFPTIPTDTNQLTNGAGFITSSGSCSYSTTSETSTYSTYLKSLGPQTPKSGRDIFHSGVYTYTTYTDTNTPAHYGAVIGYGNGQGGSCEMFAEWVGRGNLWFRVLRDCDDSWTNWQQIITSDNIGSQSVNYANSSGNADTVDGSHAWQMQTLAASGGVHGSNDWLMQCQHNVDGDGYFKLYCGDKSVGTKVDRASSAGWADSAGNSDTLDGYHEYSFLRNRAATSTSGEGTLWAQIGIKEYDGALPDGLSGIYSWGEVVSLPGTNGRFDIYCSHNSSNGNGLYYRSGWGDDKKDWRCFIDSANIGSQSVNYATNSGYTNWLRTSSHSDHLLHTEWDGSYFWTYVTAGDGGYRAVRVERSNSSGWADSAGGVAWGNVSGRPWALSQFTNDSGFITSSSLMYINGDRANNAYRIVCGSFNNNNNVSTGRHWVTFPNAFSDKPQVVSTLQNSDGNYFYLVSNVTTTGFIAEIWDGGGNRTPNGVAAFYIAIGKC